MWDRLRVQSLVALSYDDALKWMDGGAMLNCLRIALVCGIVVALAGCGKKGPLDSPDAPETSKTKFDAKALIDKRSHSGPKASAPKECKSTILDPLIGAECPQQ